jgi:predicted MFS family arabinose efflux permease
VLAAAAAVRWVTESKAHGDTRYDLPGAALVTGGLVSLVYGFTEAAKDGVGWTAGSTIGFLALAVVLLVAFVVLETRSANPLLPLRVVLNRNRGGSYLASLLVGAGLFSMFLFLTYYFQVNLGYSPLKSGFAFLPFSIGIIVTAGAVSGILPRTGPKPLMVLGSISSTVGLLLFTMISDTSSWLTHVLPGEILMSVGLGLVFVPLSSLALMGVDEKDAGVASAVLNTSQQVGGSLGTALLSTFYASTVTGYLADHVKSPADIPKLTPLAFIEGYHVAFYIGSGLLAAGALAIIVLINAKSSDLPAEAAVTH